MEISELVQKAEQLKKEKSSLETEIATLKAKKEQLEKRNEQLFGPDWADKIVKFKTELESFEI